MTGRVVPSVPEETPLVVPNLLRASELSSRLRFGGCFAAEERLRRWPLVAEKDGEATVTDSSSDDRRGLKNARSCQGRGRGVR